MVRRAVPPTGLKARADPLHIALLVAMASMVGGCVFPADPDISDLGVRRSNDALLILPALCPGENFVSGRVTDFTDGRSGAVLWDSEAKGLPAGAGTSIPIQFDGFATKVSDSKTLLIEVSTGRGDGRFRTNSVSFRVDGIPKLQRDRWLSSTQELVDAGDLTAKGCSGD
jgi:hypothetical protein